MSNEQPLKFKIGDRVKVCRDRGRISDIVSDAMLDHQDGLMSYQELTDIQDRLYSDMPLIVQNIEQEGYVLGLTLQKGLTGVLDESDLVKDETETELPTTISIVAAEWQTKKMEIQEAFKENPPLGIFDLKSMWIGFAIARGLSFEEAVSHIE